MFVQVNSVIASNAKQSKKQRVCRIDSLLCFSQRRAMMTILIILILLLVLAGCSRTDAAVYYERSPEPLTPVVEQELDRPEPAQPQQYAPPALCFIEYWLQQLTLEQKIGQLIMPRLTWQTTEVNPAVWPWNSEIEFGGFILFGDNVQSIEQVQALTTDMQDLSRLPLFISTDEEGGRVSRVGGLFEGGAYPAAFDIAKVEGLTTANAIGTAERLLSLGINMNFAPVADIWSNPANRVIGNRAFGHTAHEVSPAVAAATEGLQNSGVLATLKHFPGHGDTYEDSHYQLAFHNHDIYRFWEKEALPFISGIQAGAAAVMIGHISTPQIGGHTALLPWMQSWIDSGNLPATFSDFWLQDILRGQMGFDGLIITDALEMRALTDHFSCGQIALGAFLAGADILLVPSNPQEAFLALLEGYHSGIFDRDRLNDSVRRILRAKERL